MGERLEREAVSEIAVATCTAESISLGSTTGYLMRNSPVSVLVHH